jgi:hypothetical protein
VGFAEGGNKLVELGLQFGLATAGAVAGAAGQPGAAAVQELVTPGGLLHRDLAAQHRQHDAQLLLHGLDRWSAQQDSSTDRSGAKFRLSQES